MYGIIKVENYGLYLNKSKNIVYIIQNAINEKFEELFPQNQAGILNGMLIGETNSISKDVIEDFKESGITHLLAVSGSNVAMVIVISKLLFSRLFGKKYSQFFVIIFIILFVLISGASPSVLRAGLMAILDIVAGILVKKSNSFNNLFFSAFIIFLLNPFSLINVGFILSFAGTIGILTLSEPIQKVLQKFIKSEMILENASVTLSAQIFLLPIIAYFFNTVSIVSIFTNLFVLPIASILTVAGLITFIISLICFPIANIISVPIKYLINYIMFIANICSNIAIFNITVITPKLYKIIFYYMIVWVLTNKRADMYINEISSKNKIVNKRNLIISIVILSCLINVFYKTPKNYIEVSCIDVGQGDSFYIQTQNNKSILIDGGGSETSDYNVGENILLPYLLDRSCYKIDIIFVSHAHADHIDGVLTVIEKLKVGKVIIGPQNKDDEKILELYKMCRDKKVEIMSVSTGNVINFDNIKFEIIYPYKNAQEDNVNNLSLILKMKYANKSILFTGDIEGDSEEKIKGDIKADILKVAHHGSKTSTTENFLKRVSPQIAIISVAEKNIYGHPSAKVLERLSRYTNKIYMTKDSGEIRIRIYKNSKIFINECIKSNVSAKH